MRKTTMLTTAVLRGRSHRRLVQHGRRKQQLAVLELELILRHHQGRLCAGGEVEVFTWWADGGEKAGLDGLGRRVRRADCPDFKFVNGAVAGGAGSQRQAGAGVASCRPSDPPDTFQAHAGAELTDYINAGQVEDLGAVIRGLGLDQRLPEGPDRRPDRRRQDLLGPGQHPPRQRAVGQHDRAEEGRHHRQGADRPSTRSSPTWTSSRPPGSARRWPSARTGPS